jgi:two-component system, NtrC family, nitrogen regulation sensor histidine kinase NtrY
VIVAEPPAPAPPPRRRASDRGRSPFLDNTRRVLAGIAALIVALVGLLILANRSTALAPDFLAEFVLYALVVTDLTIVVALVFVLTRNIVKLLVERRGALPFARVRAKLVAVLLAMTLAPALLVSIVGSELIRGSVARWFDAPMGDVLASANSIAAEYYRAQQDAVAARAARLARAIGSRDPNLASPEAITLALAADTPPGTSGEVRVYQLAGDGSGAPVVLARIGTARQSAADGDALSRLAARAIAAGQAVRTVERGADGAEVMRAASPVRRDGVGPVTGAVAATDLLPATLAARARGVTDAYEGYQQLRVLRQPLTGVYLSFFLMLTLMILLTATWLGLYIAKRITRHLQQLAAAADEIRAGHLDYRVDVPNRDEFGSLAESFNRMAAELSASRSRLEQSAVELEAKHVEVEHRRRYVETVLERLATGVLSVDAGGRIRTWNSAATRLLDIEGTAAAGKAASDVFGGPGLEAFATLLGEEGLKVQEARAHDLTATRGGREIHLSVVTSPLRADDGSQNGVVVVFDDVSPLVRAQKVAAWREVARRLAHEIKNPLTPIQLSAERLRRHFADAPEATRDLVAECATTIVGEVESLKGLVDEFSQFARMPAPRAVPTDLHGVLDDALGLYDGLLSEVRFHRVYAPSLPRVSVDPEQMRRVVLNLVDNAVEAMDRHGNIEVSTAHDAAHSLVNVIVADDGPGIPPGERDKLFLPYYSTKKRGSGLGLAIVRRIVAEHGGSIEVAENLPHGTRFTIELPC